VRGQVALETLITMTALAAAILGIVGAYAKVWDVMNDTLAQKRLNYVVAMLEDAAQDCSGSGYSIYLPFYITYRCNPNSVTIAIDKKEEEIKGIRCGPGASEGKTKKVKVLNCVFTPVT
jgi:hypothetical protein